MNQNLDASTLHRGAKYFMDNGCAQSHAEAMALLEGFGLAIHVGEGIASSVAKQVALLTLINLARRTFLAGVAVVGLPADSKNLTRLATTSCLRDAVLDYGGTITSLPNTAWPSAAIGIIDTAAMSSPSWRLTWEGWRGGVIPAREHFQLADDEAVALAPMVAAAACAAEVFAYHAGDHPMAGRRRQGLSLWRPGEDWLTKDGSEPGVLWLPSNLWIIGLGNLGQAFVWALAGLPYANPADIRLVLQDDDRVAVSNDSTSMLSFLADVGERKARMLGRWLDGRGFETFLIESRFGLWTKRSGDQPSVALCGVDNALARTALDQAGFDLVVEAGLGGGPEAFRSLSLHTFPGSRSSAEIWSRYVGSPNNSVEDKPAYQAMKKQGVDACGLTQLASRTVGVPFVGLIAGILVISELLRRLHGGAALELASGSMAALESIETVAAIQTPYAFGHVDVRSSQ